MDDTISRQALMKEFSDFVRESNNSDFAPTPTWNDAVSLVGSMPSAERHGRWIENETSYADPPTKQTCNCSICGQASIRPLGDWCRWCGSRMDLDGDTE